MLLAPVASARLKTASVLLLNLGPYIELSPEYPYELTEVRTPEPFDVENPRIQGPPDDPPVMLQPIR